VALTSRRRCILKEALDHATRLRVTEENRDWIESVLKVHGLSSKPFEMASCSHGLQFPVVFMNLLRGTWLMTTLARHARST
jgi:hypothetical protein